MVRAIMSMMLIRGEGGARERGWGDESEDAAQALNVAVVANMLCGCTSGATGW